MMRFKIFAATGVLLLAAAGISFAAVPDSDDGEFHGCVMNTTGVKPIYIIDKQAGESCPAGFTEKVWDGNGVPLATVRVTDTANGELVDTGPEGDIYRAFPEAACPEGYVATGGGPTDLPEDGIPLLHGTDGPSPDGEGWRGVFNADGTSDTASITAICTLGTTSEP